MGGMGMLAVGLFTAPLIGKLADGYLHDKLVQDHQEQTVEVMRDIVETYPTLIDNYPEDVREVRRPEVMGAVERAQEVLNEVEGGVELPTLQTANAMRAALDNAPPGSEDIQDQLTAILPKADNYGGRMAFRIIAPFSLIIVVVFGVMYFRDKKAGGYQAEQLTTEQMVEGA
jgi:hypothetical protein